MTNPDPQSRLEDARLKFEAACKKLVDAQNRLKEKETLYELTPEEIQVLDTFRQFKKEIRKPSMFRYQTRPLNESTGNKQTDK